MSNKLGLVVLLVVGALWAMLSREAVKLFYALLLSITVIVVIMKLGLVSKEGRLPGGVSMRPNALSRFIRNPLFMGLLALWLAFTVFYFYHKRPDIESCPIPTPCPAARSGGGRIPRLPDGSSTQRLAIVLPFIASQVDRMFANMKLWETHKSCRLTADGSAMASGAQITMVFYFDKDLASAPPMPDGRSIEEYITQAWESRPKAITNCINGGIKFLSAKISDEENRHPEGPCLQHFALHTLLAGEFDHFLQMEPDVLPVQDFWMDGLINEVSNNKDCSDFWMKGSNSRCDGRYGLVARRHDFHMNGNALYCLNSPAFIDFIRRVQAYYPPGAKTGRVVPGCSTGKWAEDGWDHTFYQFRMQEDNFDYAKHLTSRFRYSPFIANMCEDEYNAEEMLAHDPGLLLVHSKFPFLKEDDQFLRRNFIRIVGRYSMHYDRDGLEGRDHDYIMRKLCAHNDRRYYLRELSRRELLTQEIIDDCAPFSDSTDLRGDIWRKLPGETR